jgi:hypothetical protein
MMYTVDYESVNGGIYAMGAGRTFASVTAAQAAIRREMKGLSCFWQAFIADETGRRVVRGARRKGSRGWEFCDVDPMTRVQLHDALVPFVGYEDTAHALATIEECGEFSFDRHDAYGTLHYRARYYGNGAYALDKIPCYH